MRNSNNRLIWIIGGAAATILLCALCIIALAAISPVIFNRQSQQISSAPTPILRKESTPTLEIIPQATPSVSTDNATAPSPSIEHSPSRDLETEIYTQVYERVNPSVVSIQVLDEDMLLENSEEIRPFFFNTGVGSGFVYSEEGYIITNNHVVEDAESIVVRTFEGLLAPAEVIGVDTDTDLAVIKVDPSGLDLHPVTLGNLDDLRVGDRIIVIGNPFGNTNTLTTGIVSALGRQIELPETDFLLPEVIQTDAAINPGNSGGPMLDAAGEVVGVAFMLQSESRSNSGIGFGIPVYFVDRIARAIITEGEYRHPYVGIRGNGLSPFETKALGLDIDFGILIAEVIPDTPAAKAGLRGGDETVYVEGVPFVTGGDIITAVDGQPIKIFDDLLAFLGRYKQPGDTMTLSIIRDGEDLEITITLEPRPR